MAENSQEETLRLAVEGLKESTAEMQRFQQLWAAVMKAIVEESQKANAQLGNIAEGFNAPANNAEKFGTKTVALGVILGNFATKILTSVWDGLTRVGGALLDAGSFAVNAAADFEKTRTAFVAMLGGAELADGFLQQVQEFSRSVPFAITEIEQLARQMLGMGFAVGDILPNMRMLLDVAAGTDAPLSRIVFNYAQILAQNQAYTLDLKQFAQAGIPIYEELSKVLGVSVQEVRKLVEESKVGFADVQAAFESMTSEGGRFYNITQNLAQTARGLQQVIANEFTVIARVVGGPVVESFRTALSAVWDLLRALGPGGELQEVTATITAFATVAAEEFGKFVQFGVNAVKEFGPRITEELFPAIRDALVWGAEFSANFAKGIIKGAAAALTVAVKFVTSILTFFFRPNSPPRVAPDIDQWGADTFSEYLRGFTKADFGILKSLQGPIKSSLDIIKRGMELGLESGDKSGQQALVEQLTRGYTELSIAVSGAIKQARETGVINEAVLNQVANATGRYGQEVASLLRLELQLAAAMKVVATATEQVTRAEQAQKAARDAVKSVQDRMQKAREEVQRLQEELFLLHKYDIGGEITITTAEQLKAARAHLASLEGQEESANAVVDQATAELELAQQNLSVQRDIAASISEQVDVQKDFLSQLLSMQEAQFDPFKGLTDSAKGAADAISEVLSDIGNTEIDWSKLDGGFGDLVSGIKSEIELAFKDITKPFKDAWDELMGGTSPVDSLSEITGSTQHGQEAKGPIAKLQEAIDGFVNNPAVKTFTTWIKDNPEAVSNFALAFVGFKVAAGSVGLFTSAINFLMTSPLMSLGTLIPIGVAVGFLALTWQTFGEDFQKYAPGLVDQIGSIGEKFSEIREESGYWGAMKTVWGAALTAIRDEIQPHLDAIDNTVNEWLDGINKSINTWLYNITGGLININTGDETEKNLIAPMKEKWDGFAKKTMPLLIEDVDRAIGMLPNKLKERATESWNSFVEPINTGINTFLATTLPTFVSDIVTKFKGINLWQTGKDIIQGLWNGMKSLWSSVTGWIGTAISGLISTTNQQAGVKSPSWKTEETGMYLMLGLEKGIKEYGQLAVSAASSITRQINAASVLGSARGGDVSNVVNYNVNANYQERQSPARIADDLALLSALQG